ncbi:pentatricopeptide repeat-containing protein At4g02750 [Selaginella moellendorffii]|uniref:pentatricopeptide repeat-containing protein At4g02750 n=1 Tax=Selaginella moellendorffii TaxID=88036 RepID=UPI000D1C57C8|nr:pentatricopeptide repeat-containing protein At4g02750 [Selaginella moellendorffii]|eukprot:XP_024538390.1 pentatricopeptide repeat-containing protein At4g02750 [Selaginella moellendorffii]
MKILREELHRSILELERYPIQSRFTVLIRHCGKSLALEEGRRLHRILARDGADQETFMGNLLVQMYGQCRDLAQCKQAFEKIRKRNLYSWNIMVAAYAQNGHLDLAARLFGLIPETNLVLWNAMISGYAQNKSIDIAKDLFEKMPERDVASWNSMISAFALHGECSNAVALLLEMDLEGIHCNRITLLSILDAVDRIHLKFLHAEICSRGLDTEVAMGTALIKTYGRMESPDLARSAFDRILERNIVSWNTLVEACFSDEILRRMPLWDLVSWTLALTAYARDGNLLDAIRIFMGMPERSSVTWNAMLAGCVQHGALGEADWLFEVMPARNVVTWTTMIFGGDHRRSLSLFRAMDLEGLQPNRITFLSLIDGFGSPQALDASRIVHKCAAYESLDLDHEVLSSLVKMYARCESLVDAKLLFQNEMNRSSLVYNSMLCALSGEEEEALVFLREMDLEGVKVEKSSLIDTLESCKSIAQGKILHSSIPSELLRSDTALGTSVLYMYGRHGDVITARTIFEELHERNLVAWTALISTYAQNGRGNTALELFRLVGLDGILPDTVTFAKILIACSHAGLVTHGCQFFSSFMGDYNLVPSLDHYNCLIDLLCRNGRLFDAQEVAANMPFEPNLVSWVTLLGGCSIHSDPERAFGAAQRANGVDSRSTAPYSLLSNLVKSLK